MNHSNILLSKRNDQETQTSRRKIISIIVRKPVKIKMDHLMHHEDSMKQLKEKKLFSKRSSIESCAQKTYEKLIDMKVKINNIQDNFCPLISEDFSHKKFIVNLIKSSSRPVISKDTIKLKRKNHLDPLLMNNQSQNCRNDVQLISSLSENLNESKMGLKASIIKNSNNFFPVISSNMKFSPKNFDGSSYYFLSENGSIEKTRLIEVPNNVFKERLNNEIYKNWLKTNTRI